MKTKPTPKSKPTNLVGQYFHSLKDGKIHWQGLVIGNPEPGWYLLQLYEWLGGSPNVQQLKRIEEMSDWLFYDSAEDLQFSHDSGLAREGGPYWPETPKLKAV